MKHPYSTTNPTLLPLLDRGIDGAFTPHESKTFELLTTFLQDESQPLTDRAIAGHRMDDMYGDNKVTLEELQAYDDQQLKVYVDDYIESIDEIFS